MAGEALSQGTILKVETSPGPPIVYVTIGGVENFGYPGYAREDIEVTALDSTAREYIADLPDTGESTFPLFLRKGVTVTEFEAGQERLADLAASGAIVSFQAVMPPGIGTMTWTCNGYVKNFMPQSATRNAVKADVTIRWTGAPVRS